MYRGQLYCFSSEKRLPPVCQFIESKEQRNRGTEEPHRQPPDVLREEFDDCANLFDPDSGNTFGLDLTGVFIWKHLDGKHAAEDIVGRLREEADDVPDDAPEHIRQFITCLEMHELVGDEIGFENRHSL
jgi:SynChlorMet cassette protein ScmD